MNISSEQIDQILIYGLTALIFNYPGKCIIPEFLKEPNKQKYRTQIFSLIPRILANYPNLFPISGIVRKSGSYFYLELNDDGAYTTMMSSLLDLIERTYGYQALIPANYPYPLNKIKVISPPSTVGSHVTISKYTNPSWIGKTVQFNIDLTKSLTSYFADQMGLVASNFNSNVYPIRWYVLYVKNLPSQLLLNYNDTPHISLGILAYLK